MSMVILSNFSEAGLSALEKGMRYSSLLSLGYGHGVSYKTEEITGQDVNT